MNTQQKDSWKETRQKGQFRFILGGAFVYALGITFLSFPADYGFEFFFNDTPNYLHESENLITRILIRLFIISLAGLYLFYSLWNKNEEKFFQNVEEK